MFRNIMGVSMALLLAVVVVGWILGPLTGPIIHSARDSARGQLEELIGKYKVKHQMAKSAVDKAAERVESINESVANERVAMRMLDRNIEAAQHEIDDAKLVLSGFEKRLEAKQPIVLVSGRRLDEAGVRTRVEGLTTKIGIAIEKKSFLSTLKERRKARSDKLEMLRVQAPAELRKLQQSLDFLEAKLQMYEEMKPWVEDDESSKLAVDGMFADAQDALEEAHLVIDQKLASFEAVVDATLDSADLAPLDDSAELAGDDLLADIRQILGTEDALQLR